MPGTFMPTSGKSLGVCTCKCCNYFETTFKWNFILIVYAWWNYEYCLGLFQLILKLSLESIVLLKNCAYALSWLLYLIHYCLGSYCSVWIMNLVQRMDPSLVIESPLTSLHLAGQLVRKFSINIVCWCCFLICETK